MLSDTVARFAVEWWDGKLWRWARFEWGAPEAELVPVEVGASGPFPLTGERLPAVAGVAAEAAAVALRAPHRARFAVAWWRGSRWAFAVFAPGHDTKPETFGPAHWENLPNAGVHDVTADWLRAIISAREDLPAFAIAVVRRLERKAEGGGHE